MPGFSPLPLLLIVAAFSFVDEPPRDVTEPPAYDQFLVIPLRVHILQADDLPEVDCRLTDADVRRILGKVNGIWHKAGIHFALESLRREPAELQLWFRAFRDQNQGRPSVGQFSMLLPEASRRFEGLHVYYIHRFAVNGIYMGDDFALVQETAALRPVAGGIDEPIPRVTAHELGHALGLPHRQDTTNLLASGTTGTLLNAREVERAREVARHRKGTLTTRELRDAAMAATAKGDQATARRLWTWLSEIPGPGAEEAKKRLETGAETPAPRR